MTPLRPLSSLPLSTACRSGLHCAHCRDPIAGRPFRRSLIAGLHRTHPGVADPPVADPQVADPDFACPSGRPWEFWGPLHRSPQPTPAEFERLVATLDFNRRAQLEGHMRRHPVRWDDFAAWAVEIHDAVNVSLGKEPRVKR